MAKRDSDSASLIAPDATAQRSAIGPFQLIGMAFTENAESKYPITVEGFCDWSLIKPLKSVRVDLIII